MIRMKMRDDDAPDRLAVEARRKNPVPQSARFVGSEAAINYGPAIAIVQQPEVDVLERERQGHAQPVDAGRDLSNRSGFGRLRKRINDALGNEGLDFG